MECQGVIFSSHFVHCNDNTFFYSFVSFNRKEINWAKQRTTIFLKKV
ncbi:hypothetical protein FORC085_2414 [Bacillus cereus]|nr:hypothetical protein FORC085_2414 [Bacillus cereus]